jgi:hypothetical protein
MDRTHYPFSYAVEALLGPSQLHNGAHSSSKWALGQISRNLDGWDPLSMPFHPLRSVIQPIFDLLEVIYPGHMPFHQLRSVIQPAFHLSEVIYPGHMQWKHFWGHHHCLTGPIKAQNGLLDKLVGIQTARTCYPCHFIH